MQGFPMRRAAALSSTRFFMVRLALLALLCAGLLHGAPAAAAEEDGYRLWLRYEPLPASQRERLRAGATAIVSLAPDSPTVRAARAELERGLGGLLGHAPAPGTTPRPGSVVLARAGDLGADAEVQP